MTHQLTSPASPPPPSPANSLTCRYDWFRRSQFAPVVARMRVEDHPATQVRDHAVVRSILEEHATGRKDHGELMWLLANVFKRYDVHSSTGGSSET